MAKVSIIIPVYNSEKYLEQCLNSVVNQTLNDIEIIIVNDGSTDGSASIIQHFRQLDSRIVCVSQNNQGLALARSHGFELATADYIGWVDNDDFVEPDMFEILLNTALENDSDLVICNYSFYPNKIPEKEKWFKEYKGVKDWHFIERNTHPWNKLIRRDLCEKIDFNRTLVEFSDSVYVKALLHSRNPVTINKELYHYRVGQLSVSHGYSGKIPYFSNIADTTFKQRVFLQGLKRSEADALKEYFEYRYIYALLQLLVVSAYNENKDVFKTTVHKLKSIKYKKNSLVSVILKENHGWKKAFVWREITPISYKLTKRLTKIIWGKG